MKYSGSVTIMDDQGNAVYERELTLDQIIAQLLDARAHTIGFEMTDEGLKDAAEIAEAVSADRAPKKDQKPKVRGGGDIKERARVRHVRQ